MSTFFRGITETVPSLFRGIFSERNSVPNPNLDDEDKKNPQPHLHENPQCGADDKPKTTSDKGHSTKEDKNTFNCALLFNTVSISCILLYRIGNGGNK